MVYYGPPTRLSEDSGLIRCICPYDDDDGFTIQCERCFAWLHGLCVDISPETVPDIYTCPLCVSGGRIARSVEARAAKLQQLRKEAENGLRRQRTQSDGTAGAAGVLLEGGPDGVPYSSELDEEYELLAKARGLAYQKSLDNVLDPSLPPHASTAGTSSSSHYSSSSAAAAPAASGHHHTTGAPASTTTIYHPSVAPTAKTAQTPFYQREQLPVQQHILGPSPFLHPQSSSHLHQQQPGQSANPAGAGVSGSSSSSHQGKRAGSVASNASNNSGAANKRSKSQSPGGANLPSTSASSSAAAAAAAGNAAQQAANGTSGSTASAAAPKQRKRSNHASHASLPSITQNVVLDSPAAASALASGQAGNNKENSMQGSLAAAQLQDGSMPIPPPPKKRRSASAKEKEKEKEREKEKEAAAAGTSVLGSAQLQATPGPASVLSAAGQATTPSVLAVQQAPSQQSSTAAPTPSQPSRKTRTATTSISALGAVTNELSNTTSTATSALEERDANALNGQVGQVQSITALANGNGNANVNGSATVPLSAASRDTFMSDDEDSSNEDRFEPWQFEYTPINHLKYADKHFKAHIDELVADSVEEERENLNLPGHASATGTDDGSVDKASVSSRRDSPFSAFSRPGSARPSLLGASSVLSGLSSVNRLASPAPSSGSSTPAYSSSAVVAALTPPALPTILLDPPISASEFSNKLTVKPLASSSMSLAPPACTPFSGPTCVPSLMNPYPRPTVHGVFTTANVSSGSLIIFMHGEVISGEQYRNDPVNQWHDLGLLKDHTRGLAQPWDLVLDQRRFSDETRFLRSGCHPNVFIKPVIVRKRNNEDAPTATKKGRSAARKKAELQRAVREGADFELVLGLYALQDIPKREELVLPFDWADDHVVHSLHTLLFSPSLVFPTIPSNVHSGESETEDDGIPSTSSFTYLTTSQKAQIAQCSKHLYRLSRLASQTCITLFGTSICACEKRRDCSIAWLWKLACFSESSSARNRGIIRLQDFDLNGLRLACASALATDENTWMTTTGANGKMSHKKSSTKKRRADLGALVGLTRGWEKEEIEPMTAIPPRLDSEEIYERKTLEVEKPEEGEPESMQLDDADPHTANLPPVDEAEAAQHVEDDRVAAEPLVMEEDVKPDPPANDVAEGQFSFVPPPPDEVAERTASPASPDTTVAEVASAETLLRIPEKKSLPRSPSASRPNTAPSTAVSETVSAAAQAAESDSDVTEPLPSDGSDGEEAPKAKKPSGAKSPLKGSKTARRKQPQGGARTSESKVEADDDEVVRPPKKKRLLRKEKEVISTKGRGSAEKPSEKAKKEDSKDGADEGNGSLDGKGSAKKLLRIRTKVGRSADKPTTPGQKDKSAIGSGLPSFQTKKQIQEKAKQQAAARDAEAEKKSKASTDEQTASTSKDLSEATSGSTPAPVSAMASELVPDAAKPALEAAPNANGPDLESLFSMDIEKPLSEPAPSASTEQSSFPTPQSPVRDLGHLAKESMSPIKSEEVDMPDNNKIATLVDPGESQISDAPAVAAVVPPSPAPPNSAPLRRVSFQAYKKRVSTIPSHDTQLAGEQPPLTASTAMSSATDDQPMDSGDSNSTRPILEGNIVQTPTVEKSMTAAELAASSPVDGTSNDAKSSPSLSSHNAVGSASAAQAKARLSFAAYRSRITTGAEVSPRTIKTELPTVQELKQAELVEPVSEKPTTDLPKQGTSDILPIPKEDIEGHLSVQVDGASRSKSPADKAEPVQAGEREQEQEQEQEEGELFVDPNLEPGEVEGDMQIDGESKDESALGLSLGELTKPVEEPSYTPPSRNRSLSPKIEAAVKREPPMNDARLIAQAASAQRLANAARKETESTTLPGKEQETAPASTVASNANWGSVNRGMSPPSRTDDLPTGPRVPFRGSPPSRPRAFSRSSRHGSPPSRGGASLPLSSSRPPPVPRGGHSSSGWRGRGRANSASGPPRGRGHFSRDTSFGSGGFAYNDSPGPSYGSASGRGPPPSAPRADREPPSGPRALQGPPGFSRGRGRPDGPPGHSNLPRDKGWGTRGRGRGGYTPPRD